MTERSTLAMGEFLFLYRYFRANDLCDLGNCKGKVTVMFLLGSR